MSLFLFLGMTEREKMRGGGPRLMCSPYFVGGALVLLCIVSMRYWSVSNQNAELVERIEKIQTLMKTE